MTSKLILWIFLLVTLQIEALDAATFDGELFSPEYYRWFYRWHRGGAGIAHEGFHECWGSQKCDFRPPENTEKSTVKMSVNTTIVSHLNSVELKLTFDEGHSIAMDDFVAVYFVDAEENNEFAGNSLSDFVDYVYASQIQKIGSNRFSVVFGPLVNMRASYQFRYVRKVESVDGRPTFVVLGESPYVEMERGHTEPLQVRLALTENKGEMRVMWVTGRVVGPSVQFGMAASGVLERRAEATTVTYDADDMCTARATTRSSVFFRHPGYIHDAVMTDLIPGEEYVYRVGSATGVRSPTLEFKFPVALGNDAESRRPQSFFVFGDLGTGVLKKPTDELDFDYRSPERHFTALDMVSRLASWDDKRMVMQRILQDLDETSRDSTNPDAPEYAALIHIGDVAYAKGNAYVWDQFGALVQPVASRLPYMVGVGNHEYDYTANGTGHDLSGSDAALSNGWHPIGANFANDSHGECGVPFAHRFHMPEGEGISANPPFWYSFRVGLTHHVILSSEHRCSSGAPMREWFEQELSERVDRDVTPWLIVHLHRPLYCSESYEDDHAVAKLLQGCLEDLLATSRVDLVFSGHYHAYERTCPVFRGECWEEDGRVGAPVHIMIGSGGAELDDAAYLSATWTRSRQQEYGHGRLHIYNASHARFEFLRARDRVVSDSVWIESNHNWDVVV